MLNRSILTLLCGVVPLLISSSAAAQANTAVLSAECGNAGVDLTVDMSVTPPLPSTWVGWVVVRQTIGPCEALRLVRGPEAFPAGALSLAFADDTAVFGVAYKYLIMAVDAQGNRHDLLAPDFADEWTAIDYTTCGDPAVVRGAIFGDAARAWMSVCLTGCWEFISHVDALPGGLVPLLGSGDQVELRGSLHFGADGPYITDVTGWTRLDGCGTVVGMPSAWGAAKARFR